MFIGEVRMTPEESDTCGEEITPEDIRNIGKEVKRGMDTCPPWHRVSIGADGNVYTIGYIPNPRFGEPIQGDLWTGEEP
jgi:hypothetical protein